MQSINLTQPESRIVLNLFVKKLFYALNFVLKKLYFTQLLLLPFVLNVLSLESVEKISLSHSVEGGQVLNKIVLPVFIKNVI